VAKPKKVTPFDVKMSAAELADLGGELAREIDDAFTARSAVIDEGGLIDLADWFYEQGRSQPQDRPFPGAADLTSYFITENVDAMKARLMKAIFGVRPFCFVEGWGPDAKKAPYVEEFHDWQVRKSDLKAELGKTILGALIEDGYILEVSEKIETRKITEQINVALELHPTEGGPIFEQGPDGQPRPKLQTDEHGEFRQVGDDQPHAKIERTHTKTKRLGPQYDAISMKDFVFLPGHAKSQKQVYGYAYRFWKRVDELDEAVEDGIYDKEAVKAIGEESDRQLEKVPQPVENVAPQYGPAREKELFQLSLMRDLDGDGRAEWYMATVSLKSRTLLRLKLDSFAQKLGRSRCVPFMLYPRRDSVYGYSYAFDKLLTLAEEHTGSRNMIADRSALATNAPIMQEQGGLWDAEAEPFGVGRVIKVRSMNELKQMQILDVPASAIQRENMLHVAKERVGGLSDSASGVLSAERRTLGEQKLVAGGSAVRVDEVIGYLHTAIADVMALSHAIWADTLKADPKGLDAPTSVVDLVQARMPAGQEFDGKFTADMLTGDFQFEPYGSDTLADPQRRRQDFDTGFLALANLGKVFPGIMAIMSNQEAAQAVVEQWCRAYDVRDRQPFLKALMAPPIPQPVSGAGPSPMGAPMPGAGAPPMGGPNAGIPGADVAQMIAALGAGAHG
jgi:hypothetical protein